MNIEIELINWEKFAPRADRANHVWFRLQNNIISEPKFFGLSASQKFIAICIFAEASKKSGKALVHIEWFCDQLKVKRSDVDQTIKHLVDVGVIRLPLANQSPPSPEVTAPFDALQYITNNTVQTEHNKQNKASNNTSRTEVMEPPATAVDDLDPKNLFALWNENCATLPKAKITEARKAKARAQLKKYPDEEHWLSALKRLTDSEFCITKWKPCFDDFVDETKRIRALEGAYDNRVEKIAEFKTHSQRVSDSNMELLRRVRAGEV